MSAMNRTRTILLYLSLGSGLLLTGCPGDDGSTPVDTEPTTSMGGTTTDPDSTGGTVDPPGTTDDDSTGTTGDPPEDEYDFDDSPPDAYTRVDRMGMPAINTAVISSKDEYNAASPADDANGDFVDEIVANLTGLHDALDDDLMGAGLVPCLVDDCVAQAAPLVVPDTLKIDLTGTAGFPNGRLPTDPVIDVTLAVIMLDLSEPGQDATTLIGLNPTENDVPFSDDFPFFAPPHL
jgi:hypothetical protein